MARKSIEKTGNMKSARQLGEIVGLSAREVNVRLKEKGYLTGEPGNYQLTQKGEEYAETRYKDNGYGGYAARGWEFLMWDECMIYEISDKRFPGINWYCDGCNSFLNIQKGFDDHKKTWKCTECGFKNEISLENIIRKD